MNKLTEKVKALFESENIKLAIGFEEGNHGPRPFFCRSVKETDKLILDERCIGNTGVYITKPELIGTDKVLLIANLVTLRSILQLASENQLKEEQWIILTQNEHKEVILFNHFEEIKNYLQSFPLTMSEENRRQMEQLQNMSREERWQYWTQEMSKCIKCYACRAACPLCYCSRCVVEVNCPQWIQPWSAPLSNMEWQINRVMHMAGRCVGCEACKQACPVGIPLHLLQWSLMEDIQKEFGKQPGNIDNKGNVLSTFKVEDKENFIR